MSLTQDQTHISPALAGGFCTAEPPGSWNLLCIKFPLIWWHSHLKTTWKHHPGIKICGFSTFLLLRAIHLKQNATNLGWYMLTLYVTTILLFLYIQNKFYYNFKDSKFLLWRRNRFLRIYPKFITIFFKPGFSVPVCCTTCPFGIFPHASRAKEVSFYHFYFSHLLVKKIVYTN